MGGISKIIRIYISDSHTDSKNGSSEIWVKKGPWEPPGKTLYIYHIVYEKLTIFTYFLILCITHYPFLIFY